MPGFYSPLLAVQSTVPDSLLVALTQSREDTVRVNTLNDIGEHFLDAANYDSALVYGFRANELAGKLQFTRGSLRALLIIGMSYYYEGNYSLSLSYLQQCLKQAEERGNKLAIAGCFYSIGILYQSQGNYPAAIQNYVSALKNFEGLEEGKIGEVTVYNNIASIYSSQKKFPEALKNYLDVLRIVKETGDKESEGLCYVNIGSIYSYLENYDLAMKNYKDALNILAEIGDSVTTAYCYNNMGDIDEKNGRYKEALEKYSRASEIWRLNGDKVKIAVSFINIGSVFTKQKRYEEANKYLEDALQIVKQAGAKEELKECYNYLSVLKESMGDYKGAHQYYKLYAEVKDSLLNEVNNKQVAEMITKYEAEKKDKENELLKKDKEIQAVKISKQKAAIEYLIGGFILVIVSAWIVFYIYNQKRRTAFRHELLEIKMKALRAQMNPHFTFNILNSIQYYAGQNNMKAVQHYLHQFSKLIRMSLEQSRTSYVSLAHEVAMLKLYLELEEMRFEKKFDYCIETGQELNPAKLLLPGMLIQPIVENAIKHGIEHKEGEAMIKISFHEKNNNLVCKVTDNGIGREEAMRHKSGDSYNSVASSIIKERMDALSSIYDIRLECKTEDLFDDAGLPAGTSVVIEVPIKVKGEDINSKNSFSILNS